MKFSRNLFEEACGKKSRYTDSQILRILKQAENDVPAFELWREHGISSAAPYQWRSNYGVIDALLVKLKKELKAENRHLKKMYAKERLKPEALTMHQAIDQAWSMEFTHDELADGRSFWSLNVLDGFNPDGLGMEIDLSLPSGRVIRCLEQIIELRGKPEAIRCDNSPEYISGTLITWGKGQGVRIEHMQPGKLQQNAYVERYNRTFRYDRLGQYIFDTNAQVQQAATKWLRTYINERPDIAIGGTTPVQQMMAI